MDILYYGIIKQLKTNVPSLKWIGWDNGEIDLVDSSYPISYPNVLIDFVNFSPETVGGNVQIGDLLIRLRISFRIYDDMNSIAPDTSRTAGLTILKQLNEIYKALQGWSGGEHYNELERVAQNREQRNDELTVYTMDFVTNFRDAHASPDYVEVENVNLEIDNTNE
jgi:hypothetical protein